MSLSGCQQKADEVNSDSTANPQELLSPAQQKTAPSIKAGAHGSYDPHSKLTSEKHIQVALQHRDEGRVGEALDVLERAIVKYSQQAKLYSVRASILMEKGDVTSALQDLETAVKLQPDEPLTLTNRAQVYRSFGRIKESLADLDKAINIAPDLVAARFNRGAIYFSSGEYKSALKDFDHCIAVEPHNAAPYFNRAATYDALGKKKLAIADLKRFIELSKKESWKNTANELLKKWQAGNNRKESKSKS